MKMMYKQVTRKHRDGTQTVHVKQKRFFCLLRKWVVWFAVRLKGNMYLTVLQINFRPFGIFLFCWAREGELYRGGFRYHHNTLWSGNTMHVEPIWISFGVGRWVVNIKRRRKTILRAEQKRISRMYGSTHTVTMDKDGQLIMHYEVTGVRLLCDDCL